MQGNGLTRRVGRCAMGTAVLVAMAGGAAMGDDGQGSSLLGRLFRMGGSSSSGSNSNSNSNSDSGGTSNVPPSRLPYGGATYNSLTSSGSTYGNALPPGGSSFGATVPGPAAGAAAAPLPSFGGLPQTPPVSSSGGTQERLTPRSRVSSAVTTADPVLTRFALGKSNDGSSFGMFLQIFADGTVVDSEGVHHVRPADLKPIVEAVQSGELYRLRGHCGAPSTDFIEYVHIVAYERRLGRLQAHSFSYSGNPQGCDHVIRHLHAAIENLQAKISRPAMPTGTTPAAMSPAGPPIGAVPPATLPYPASPAIPGRGAASIPLTPPDPGH